MGLPNCLRIGVELVEASTSGVPPPTERSELPLRSQEQCVRERQVTATRRKSLLLHFDWNSKRRPGENEMK